MAPIIMSVAYYGDAAPVVVDALSTKSSTLPPKIIYVVGSVPSPVPRRVSCIVALLLHLAFTTSSQHTYII
jgi:hypothetical protein